ncbi:Serine/threonine protein kinase [Parasponia andersonii]|uniref:Serine/threonine protein kinase n=1 Tax=Parasponia andersonii TaxID=3476 RepID=A0A2P5B3H8_PARAD|nr:Serine/threonine protein kinase [Parasponia andersonii]
MAVVHRAKEAESSRVNLPLNSQSYKILTKLSSGPRVVVYKAECLPLNSELVAIKAIDFEGRSAQSLIDLIRGANTLASSLSHPNLLSAHCSFIAEDYRYWVVMPFLPAGSVLSVMYKSELGYWEAVTSVVLREVLKGLVYLHGQGKFHGDIKTGNILVGSTGSVSLADYGVSESCYDPGSGRFRPSLLDTTTTGNDVPYWVAPEKEYSPKSDIWTVGIVALEMGYGRPPLSQRPGTESMILRLRKRFGSWKYEKSVANFWSFEEEYKDMVSLCLDQDPAKRPSAEDLLKHAFFLKYSTMGSTVIKEHLILGFGSFGRGHEEDKIPRYLLTPTRFVTAWKFNRETILMDPEIETLTRTDSLVRRIEEWKLDAAIAEMDSEITGETSTRQMSGLKLSREKEMAEEIKALKVALETEEKRKFELEASIETIENLITYDFKI